MEKIALFPGSFDPYTNGHHDIVLRGLKIFDRVIISIGHNTTKTRYFPLDTVIESIENTYRGMDRISVVVYNELTAEYAKKYDAKYLLRGLRNTTDFEYENSISQVNRYLNDTLETVFLITSPEYAAINSSIIREVHKYGGDISHFIPHPI
ncbi:MAG: pantetheine-phosphate adenylyltransferase [Cyclobacteriaceae bacterium]|nr:pantetheine-phosphate adenylyltransferase [Cyclobacteriaceae bacterium]